MSLQVTDAYGRPVESLGICARCGAHIKYIFTFEDKTYGSECIEVVTGIGKDYQVFKGRELDRAGSLAKKAEAEQKRQERIQKQQELDQLREGIRQTNQTRYASLISVLNNASKYQGDFCSEMARTIGNDGFSTELSEILSWNQLRIVREIWGKQYGRMNSKAYEAGVTEFDEKFNKE